MVLPSQLHTVARPTLEAWAQQRAGGASPVMFRVSTAHGRAAWSVLIPNTAIEEGSADGPEGGERIVSGLLETPEDLETFVGAVMEHSPEDTVVYGNYSSALDSTLRALIPCANGIPDGPKERLKQHMQMTVLKLIRTPDPVTVYADASTSAHRNGVGLGWAIVGGGLRPRFRCKFLPRTNHILIGEVMAIMHGLRGVAELPEPGIVVVRSDSRGALGLLRSCWDGDSVRQMGACHDEFQDLLALTRSLDVRFQWVKGHNGNVLNEAVDRLAVGTRRNHQMDLGHLDSVLMARVAEDLKLS